MPKQTPTRRISVKRFLQAICDNKQQIINQYIDENKNNPDAINAANERGYTAVMKAALNGLIERLNILLVTPGINVNAINYFGDTALIFAARCGHTECIKALLAAPGIQVNARNQSDSTALMFAACFKERAESIKALLTAHDIDVNVADLGDHMTALAYAAAFGHTENVKVLLTDPRVNLLIKDKNGKTAADLARKHGHTDIAILINAAISAKIPHNQKQLDDIVFEGTVPEDYCDFSAEIMTDPVTLSSGHTIDRIKLTEWCNQEAFKDQNTFPCPVSKIPIPKTELANARTNIAMKHICDNFVRYRIEEANTAKLQAANTTKNSVPEATTPSTMQACSTTTALAKRLRSPAGALAQRVDVDQAHPANADAAPIARALPPVIDKEDNQARKRCRR